ncbi:hypothetical protein CsSME_00048910 [Camellia sinensis var. sinensis]
MWLPHLRVGVFLMRVVQRRLDDQRRKTWLKKVHYLPMLLLRKHLPVQVIWK